MLRNWTIALCTVLTVLSGVGVAATPDAGQTELSTASWIFSTLETTNGENQGHALVANAKNGRGVGFRCINGNLLGALSLEPANILAALMSTHRQRTVRVFVSIGDTELVRQDWIMFARHRVIVSGDHKVTRALYNAAVLREPIRLDPRRHGDGIYIYNLPAPDPEAFATFMEACNFSSKSQ